MTLANLNILTSPAESREDALRLVFGNIAASTESLADILTEGSEDKLADLRGLFEARANGKLVGAVWVQLMPGKTAILWPPGIVPGENEATRQALMQSVLEYLAPRGLSMVQTLVDSPDDKRCPVLAESGFTHLVDLKYLVSLESNFPKARPLSPIQFESLRQVPRERLAAVIEQTYSQTRDCPDMCGARNMEDVLHGYEKTGTFSPERWWVVHHTGQDIGCLLLTDHPAHDYLELLYMGITPTARGNGWGKELVKFAQWQTRLAKRTRLVLAVDAANQPALINYEACGFASWDQKTIYWRRYSP